MIARLVWLVVGALAITAGLTEAQPARKLYRIGYLDGGSLATSRPGIEQFQQGLRDLGYTEDQNVVIEYRTAEGQQERLPELAAELVRLKVDLIVAPGAPAARAAQRSTPTVPIVMVSVGDPVGLGLIASLARPGGNVTGTASYLPDLGGKPLELLKEAISSLKRVAVLWNPANPLHSGRLKDLEGPARALGIQLQPFKIMAPNDFQGAYRLARNGRAEAILILGDPMFNAHRARLAALALDARVPTVGAFRSYVDEGGLMSYGPDLFPLFRRTAYYVDKILKGTRPGDLPVEQPTKFELVINLKTAKALGLTIPPSLLLRADQVIE